MRFLAYGGTAYLERRRIGDWRELPDEGTFSSLYGLRGGKIVYGVGLIDNLPTLIFKRLTAWNTRSYSYTILLDPGEQVWKNFELNFAQLFIAILKEPGLQNLFNKPEAVNEREVDQILNDLNPPMLTSQQIKDETENIQNLWTYFAVKGEKFAFSPAKYSLMAVPNLPEMINILNQIPKPLRIGYGWLLNGNAINAEEFKANFVLDDEEATLSKDINEDDLKKYIAEGRKYRQAWNMIWDKRSVETNSETNEIDQIRELSETPIHLWQEKLKFNCEILFSRIGLLAKINKYQKSIETLQSDDENELFEQISQVESSPHPLGEEIKRAIFDLSYNSEKEFGIVGTKYFLEQHFNKVTIGKNLIIRLDQKTIIDELLKKESTPTESGLVIDSNLRTKFWLRKLEFETEKGNVEKLCEYLFQALTDLKPLDDLDGSDQERISNEYRPLLFNKAIDLAIKETPLLGFQKLAQHFQIPLDAKILQLESRRRIFDENYQLQSSAIIEEYLSYANDRCGDFLAENITKYEREDKISKEKRLDEIIKEIIRLAKGNDHVAKVAQQWLAEIAHSDLRKQININTKIQIDKSFNIVSWNNFRNLFMLAEGLLTNAELNEIKRPSENEIPRLSQELNELVSILDLNKNTPNFYGLINFFDNSKYPHIEGKNYIGEQTLEKLRKATPPLTIRDFDKWIRGWNIIGERSHAEKEIIRFALKHSADDKNHYESVCNKISNENFSDENLKEFCQKLLVEDSFSNYPTKNDHIVNLFIDYSQKLSDKSKLWKKWQEIIDEVLTNISNDEKKIFYQNFSKKQDYYNKWCETLPKKFQTRFLEIFYELDETKFLEFAENVHKSLGNDNAWLAIADFLEKNKKNETVYKALARNLKIDFNNEITRVISLLKKGKGKRKRRNPQNIKAKQIVDTKVKVRAKEREDNKGVIDRFKSWF